MKTVLKIEGMMCEGCAANVESALGRVEKVTSATVDLKSAKAVVIHDGASDESLISAVVDAGFRASVKHGLFS